MNVENRMVVDGEWTWLENGESEEDSNQKEKGYYEMNTNVFVPDEDAYEYALERCMNGTEEDQKEFKEMLVEWFFSGNWIREE
jgi:hypothetical protein